MVPKSKQDVFGPGVFLQRGNGVVMSDEALIALGTRELEMMGLARAADVESGTVIRQLKTYPVYTGECESCLERIRGFLDSMPNLQTVGKQRPAHVQDNQDHSMLTAMLAVKNLLGQGTHDVWSVNVKQAYHEEVSLPSSAVD